MKNKYETDIAEARKRVNTLRDPGLVRDKSDLQQTIDTLKAENARAERGFPRFNSPLTPGTKTDTDFLTPAGFDDDSDVFGTTGGASTNRRKLDIFGMLTWALTMLILLSIHPFERYFWQPITPTILKRCRNSGWLMLTGRADQYRDLERLLKSRKAALNAAGRWRQHVHS